MFTDFLAERFAEQPDADAVIAPGARCTFAELLALRTRWHEELERLGVAPGTVVALEGEFSPQAVALFLALVDRAAIVVPYSSLVRTGRAGRDDLAMVEATFTVDERDEVAFTRSGRTAEHELYAELRRRGHPGLVLFSSGTSGEPKAAVHDFTFLLEKFQVRRPAYVTLNFLLFDHLGGINTMLHTLSNGATVIGIRDRSPETVCALIEEHGVELLPATPSFYNLLLLSGAHRRHDLGSLKLASYGAEPMPQSTLERLREALPGVRLQQTYGLIEVGALRTKSREDGSLWVRVGGEGFQTRVVDGILQLKTRATILGYLNAPTPITEDGWFITGDAVEQDGEWFRILGRKSELINVGGEKVYPAEVESVIQTMDGVEEALVFGEKNPLLGNIVCARVKTVEPVGDGFASEVKRYCAERLERFKVPVKVEIVEETAVGDRLKKVRRT